MLIIIFNFNDLTSLLLVLLIKLHSLTELVFLYPADPLSISPFSIPDLPLCIVVDPDPLLLAIDPEPVVLPAIRPGEHSIAMFLVVVIFPLVPATV